MDNRNSLFRDMIKTALDKDLNKTELQVFLVILMQTLGYGKASDPLSYGRIARTMNKRKDHVKQSARNVVKAGLFDTQKHPYFNFTYTIGVQFLLNHRGDFFTPTLPKTGKGLRKMEKFTENWGHTALDLNNPLSKQLPTAPSDSNFEKNPQKMPQTENPRGGGGHDEIEIQSASGGNNYTPLNPEPEQVNRNEAKKSIQQEEKYDNPFDWSLVKLPRLPDTIRAENQPVIHGLFKQGTLQQAENALLVYHDMQSKRFVHSPTGLLKSLINRAHTNCLTLPDVVEAAPIAPDLSNVPLAPSHKIFNPDPLADLNPEERQQHQLKEDMTYLSNLAHVQNKSMTEIAIAMKMEHVLPYLPAIEPNAPQQPSNETQAAEKPLSKSIAGMMKQILQEQGIE